MPPPAPQVASHLLAGQPTAIVRAGTGPSVVLLHGSADTAAAWRDVVALLAVDHDVWAPTLPAFPAETPAGAVAALDIDLPWLDALMAASGARLLVAHSYGALLALRWALGRPGALDRLVLGEPIAWGIAHRDPTTATRLAELDRECRRAFARNDSEAAMNWLVDYWNGPGFWRALPARIQQAALAGAPRTFAEVTSGSADATSADELARLQVPTVMLCGSQTTPESQVVSRAIAAAIPGATLRWLDRGGHAFLRSHAVEVAAAVRG